MRRLLHLLLFLALIPSLLALLPRIHAERPGPVVLVLDAEAVRPRAKAQGQGLLEALLAYRKEGVGGVAFPERLVKDWVAEGALLLRQGLELREMGLPARADWYYLKGEGWLLDLLQRAYELPTERLGEWLGFPVDVQAFPAFYPFAEIQQAKEAGFYVVVRPINHPLRRLEAGLPLVPGEADAVVFQGLEALGHPYRLEEAKALVPVPVALIEGTPQAGLQAFWEKGFLRLFSLRYEWQLTLSPEEAADKYTLAARERGHQLLYLRPYPYPQDTLRLLKRLREGLEASGIPLGSPRPRDFTPSPLRYAAWVGVLAGLGLLALGLPVYGPWVAFLLLLLALGYAGSQAGPLLAALVFPVLGFLGPRNGLWMWARSLGYALAGAVFLSALGSSPATVLGLTPFKGVSLTLLVPPLLVAYSFLDRDFKEALARLYLHPLRLGEVALGGLALGLLALALLRRGNDAPLVPELELKLRSVLQDLMVRPRFKEVFGHGLFPLALLLPWPRWAQNGLLFLASLGIASILNTFSHYHTPLSISFFRVVNGALLGVFLGLLGVILVRRLRAWWSG
ncbi:hypothetical protein SAMN04488243_12131 [Thermus arciformis]|uniref:Uncharacterized protein n=1 Tax=Thermus arciformis TaxID=482827 RepID=A0A1G7HTM6_9DEIN|nr:DUF5693 family protein [Thermus arciformis]SDF03399.1 hypothetical protein SAMN04488243_12131 [Thermus arciformis]